MPEGLRRLFVTHVPSRAAPESPPRRGRRLDGPPRPLSEGAPPSIRSLLPPLSKGRWHEVPEGLRRLFVTHVPSRAAPEFPPVGADASTARHPGTFARFCHTALLSAKRLCDPYGGKRKIFLIK